MALTSAFPLITVGNGARRPFLKSLMPCLSSWRISPDLSLLPTCPLLTQNAGSKPPSKTLPVSFKFSRKVLCNALTVGWAGRDTGSYGQLLEIVHQLGDPNPVGTPGAARLAGSAYPDRARLKHLGCLPKNCQPDDLVGKKVHREARRAAVGTFAALKTFRRIERSRSFGPLEKTEIRCQNLLLHDVKRSPINWNAEKYPCAMIRPCSQGKNAVNVHLSKGL